MKVGDHVVQREVNIGGGHAGGQIGWIHFGLGPSDEAEIRVQWPDGAVGPWMTVDANQFVTITRDVRDSAGVDTGGGLRATGGPNGESNTS